MFPRGRCSSEVQFSFWLPQATLIGAAEHLQLEQQTNPEGRSVLEENAWVFADVHVHLRLCASAGGPSKGKLLGAEGMDVPGRYSVCVGVGVSPTWNHG